MKHTRKQFFGVLAAACTAPALAAKLPPTNVNIEEARDRIAEASGVRQKFDNIVAKNKTRPEPPRTYTNEHWANEGISYENVTTMHKALADNYSALMKPLWFALAPHGREMEFCMSRHAVNIDSRGEGFDCYLTFKDLPCLRYDRIVAFHRYPQDQMDWPYTQGNRIEVVAIVDRITGLPVEFTEGSTINVKLWGDLYSEPSHPNNIQIEWPFKPFDLGGE
jgi:hypothetical protein